MSHQDAHSGHRHSLGAEMSRCSMGGWQACSSSTMGGTLACQRAWWASTCLLSRRCSLSSQRRQGRSLTIENRLHRGHQLFEFGSAQVVQEMLPQGFHVNARRSAKESSAPGAEHGHGAALVALEDAPPHEATLLELIDRPGDAAGGENQP